MSLPLPAGEGRKGRGTLLENMTRTFFQLMAILVNSVAINLINVSPWSPNIVSLSSHKYF